ncbi:MAG: cytochrome c [Pseudomonadota bacterium]|nr:cytochrome c [Pseudomonadota bacterium]
MKPVRIAVIVLLLAAGGALAFAYSGVFDVAATTRDAAVLRWILETTREHSVRSRAAAIVVPELSNEDRLSGGAKAFEEMCAGCHGAPGREPFLGAGDMNPPPPDLAGIAAERTPQELFWVVKNGLRMTGMPAWGPTHDDEQLWDLVAFMGRLPRLTPDGYRALAEGPGTDGHDHEHGVAAHADARTTFVDARVSESAGSAREAGHAHAEPAGHAH